ncbi:MAG TPA: prolyl oligopeptidase family serine peptidase [Puia sp.]
MGWSQGGYISAFLTTHTHIFKAISVGAGISDWETYYVSTDITPFTRQYLKATPWEDRAIYEKTSPMAAINQATTPTQIQHGELDRRVPISDAHELYRGLLLFRYHQALPRHPLVVLHIGSHLFGRLFSFEPGYEMQRSVNAG